MKTESLPRVFVLGAAGFIGRALTQRLSSAGIGVVAATRRPFDFAHHLVENAVSPFEHAEDFEPWLHGVDCVVHVASSSTPGSTQAQPQLDGNLRTSLSLVEAMQTPKAPRLVFLSSGGTVYGDCANEADETAAMRPRSYHGAGKVAAEAFFCAWAGQYLGTSVILRPSNVYGPGQYPRPGFGVIATALSCLHNDKPFTLLGQGEAVRDYLYLDDLIDLCLRALRRPLPPGHHVFNAASGLPLTLNALLKAIEAATNRQLQRRFADPRRVDVSVVALDIRAARRALGWMPRTDLAAGIRRTWQWVLEST